MYYRYVERNLSGEGEIWSVFIKSPETDEEQARFDALKKLTRLSESMEEEDSYYFDFNKDGEFRIYTQEEVDFLLRENAFAISGYVLPYHLGEIRQGVVALAANTEEETPWYVVQEMLYKMQPIKTK